MSLNVFRAIKLTADIVARSLILDFVDEPSSLLVIYWCLPGLYW